jgi:hypothetical protein
MAVWTISAQPGTPGREVAARLSAHAQVPLFDRKALEPIVHEFSPELGDLDDIEGRFGGRLNALALAAAMTYGAPPAFREFELRRTPPDLDRKVMGEVAAPPGRDPHCRRGERPGGPPRCGTRAALGAEGVAVAAHSRTEMVGREQAAHEVAHADHVERAWVHALFDVRVDAPTLYTVVLDASRLPVDRIVGVLLAAGDAT